MSELKPNWKSTPLSAESLLGETLSNVTSLVQKDAFATSILDANASLALIQSISIFFEGIVQVDLLYSALLNLIDRHESLRSRFSRDGNHFIVQEGIGFELPILNLEVTQKQLI